MYIFDAKIVAVDNAALTTGTFVFCPDSDSEFTYSNPSTALIAVEINERVTHIRPVTHAKRRIDGFFDAEGNGMMFSSEKITSVVLGDQSSPGHAARLEAIWTGPVGLLRGPCRAKHAGDQNSVLTSLSRLTLRSSLTNDGLWVSLTGEIGGTIFVGNVVPKAVPKGRVDIEFTLPWSWIAIRGWSLIWAMPLGENAPTPMERKPHTQDPRHFESLLLRAPAASPILTGTMTLNGRGTLDLARPDAACNHLAADIDETRLSIWPCSTLEHLDTGLLRTPICGPFVEIVGLGFAAMEQVLAETDAGSIELLGNRVGTLTFASDDDREIAQTIEAVSASATRSATGISLSVQGTTGPLRVNILGTNLDETEAAAIDPIERFEINVLIPTALLTVRNRRLRRIGAPEIE